MATKRAPAKRKRARSAPAPRAAHAKAVEPATEARTSAAPVGRPRIELTTEQMRQIEVMAGLGLTRDEVAAVLGVSPKTLGRRKADTEEVADAFDRGRAVVTKQVLDGLATKAKTGYPAAVKLYLTVMRRPGFTEAPEGEKGGSGVTINLLGGPTGLEVAVVSQGAEGTTAAVAVTAPDAKPQGAPRAWNPKGGAVASAAAALLAQLTHA